MRERIVPIIIGVLVIAAVAGIGYLIVRTVQNRGATVATTSGPIPIRIWRLNQDEDPIRGIIDDYNTKNTAVKVTYTRGSADTYELDALQSLAAKTGPEIWSIPNDWLGDQAKHLVALPNTFFYAANAKSGVAPADRVKQIFPPGIAEQIISPAGGVFGLPTNVDVLKLYYNPDFFASRFNDFRQSLGSNASDTITQPVEHLLDHPPTTWDELLQQLKYLNKKDSSGTLKLSGIAIGTADNTPYAEQVLQLLMYQNGTDIVSSDHTRAVFALPITTPRGAVVRPGQNALDFFTSFADPTRDNYSWSPSFSPALDDFAQGKVGMVIGFTEFGRDLKTKYPNFTYSIAPVPQLSLQQPLVNFMQFKVETVTAAGSNPTAAFPVLKSYANIDGASAMAQEQSLHSPFLTTLNQEVDNGDFQAKEILTARSVFKKNRVAFDQAFHDAIVNVTQNKVSPAQALDVAADTINNILSPIPSPTVAPSQAK